jgi:hypothetical protein
LFEINGAGKFFAWQAGYFLKEKALGDVSAAIQFRLILAEAKWKIIDQPEKG